MSLLEAMVTTCKKLGINEAVAHANLALYLELIEVKKLWDVSWEVNERLKLLYCKGSNESGGTKNVYVSVSCNDPFQISMVESIQDELQTESVTLAVRSPDSTTVYYEVSKGLLKPH